MAEPSLYIFFVLLFFLSMELCKGFFFEGRAVILFVHMSSDHLLLNFLGDEATKKTAILAMCLSFFTFIFSPSTAHELVTACFKEAGLRNFLRLVF